MEHGPMRDGLPEPALGQFATADGKVAGKGSELFNYYDLKWGHVVDDPDDEGWFTFEHQDGTRATLNGERVAAAEPAWFKNRSGS